MIDILYRFANAMEDSDESQSLRDRLIASKPEVLALLNDESSRLLAASALARIDSTSAEIVLPILIEGLKSDNEDDHVCAAIACEALGPFASLAVPALIEVAGRGGIVASNRAILALGAIGPAAAEATPVLTSQLGVDDESNAKEVYDAISAAAALAGIGPGAMKALPRLRECLRLDGSDEHRLLRLTAAEAIWRVSGRANDALRVATELLDDEHEVVRKEAVELLRRVTQAKID